MCRESVMSVRGWCDREEWVSVRVVFVRSCNLEKVSMVWNRAIVREL